MTLPPRGSPRAWTECYNHRARWASGPRQGEGLVPKDMRTWIDELDAAGELIRIDKPVDPLTQMGALLYQSREKALFFENLPHGWRSLGQAPANVRHAAIAFGTTLDT